MVSNMSRDIHENRKYERVVVITTKDRAVNKLPTLAEQAGFYPASHKLTLLKPNVCGMYPPSLELLESVIRYLKPYSKSVIIGETPSMMHTPNECFNALGITELAERLGVSTRDLIIDDIVQTKVPKPHAMKEIPLPSTVVKADLLVNCPGLGTHRNVLLTCALKNLFGLISERNKFSNLHPKGVSEVVADVFQIVKPNLNVVDCNQKVLIGIDALSVDIVASDFEGLLPNKVKHLVLAAQDIGMNLEDFRINRLEL